MPKCQKCGKKVRISKEGDSFSCKRNKKGEFIFWHFNCFPWKKVRGK